MGRAPILTSTNLVAVVSSVAIRVLPSSGTNGMMTSLPQDIVVETIGPSSLGTGLTEVVWDGQRYAVFERDLKARATVMQPAVAD